MAGPIAAATIGATGLNWSTSAIRRVNAGGPSNRTIPSRSAARSGIRPSQTWYSERTSDTTVTSTPKPGSLRQTDGTPSSTTTYGPTIAVYRRIAEQPDQIEALDEALAELARGYGDESGAMDWEYLLVTARRR